jgi:hypothetical protein
MQAVHHRLGRDIDVSDQLEIVPGFSRQQHRHPNGLALSEKAQY